MQRIYLAVVVPIFTAFIALAIHVTAVAGGGSVLVRETIELAARRSSRELVEKGARETAEQTVESAIKRYGPNAATAIAEGGLELIEAGSRYGDDVMRVAVEASPAARRALALDAGNLVPMVRELGQEALELEARSPGIARKVFTNFGPDGAKRVAATVPAEDMPRLVAYAERADTPQTRKVFLEAYGKEGPGIFERIPPTLVLAGGLTTALIYGTHRVTSPLAAVSDQIAKNPDLAKRALDWTAIVGGGLFALVIVTGLWRWGWFRSPTIRNR
jgi:hypothetical protein